MDLTGFRSAVEGAFGGRIDVGRISAVYLPIPGAGLSFDVYWDATNEEEEDAIETRTLFDFDWTFEFPPASDDRVELWEAADAAFLWWPPDDDWGREWQPIAKITPSDAVAAYEWVTREIVAPKRIPPWDPQWRLLRNPPTTLTLMAPDRLSLKTLHSVIRDTVREHSDDVDLSQLLDRVVRAVRYRGPAGTTRERQDTMDALGAENERLQHEDFKATLRRFAKAEAIGAARVADLLASEESREQLVDMYVALCCRTKQDGTSTDM